MLDHITLRIAGQEFAGWTSLEILQSIDRPALFRMSAPALPDDPEFRERFRPFQFKATDVALDGERLITGVQVNIIPEATADSATVTIEGYSLGGGLLQDVCMPQASWPLEFSELRIRAIAQRLCEPFGIEVAPVADEGAPFERVRLDPTQTVLSSLTQLAQQRGLLISSTPEGQLLLQRAVAPGSPVFSLGPGDTPRGGIRPTLSGQGYASEVVGMQRGRLGRPGSVRTAANPFLPDIVRPHCFAPEDAQDGDSPTAVDSKLGRMVAAAATYALTLPGWRDPRGGLLAPNTTIRMREPRSMVYTETEFLIRSVRLVASAAERYAELELVLPGAFGGPLPEVPPWEG